MSAEELPRKRVKVDNGYASSPSPSPIRLGFRSATPSLSAVVLYDPIPVKRVPVSLTELVTSRTVTINIGPQQDSVNVSTSLFQGISEPLHQLLNSIAVSNDDLSEVNKYLQHDDKDAFLQLISLAYNTILKGANDGRSVPPLIGNGEDIATSLLGIDASIPKVVKCRDCVKGNIWLDVRCDSAKVDCKAPRLNKDYGLQFFFELQLLQSHNLAAYVSSKQVPQIQHPDPINTVTGKPYPLIYFAKAFNLAAKWQVGGLQHTSLLGFQNRLKKYIKAVPDEHTLEELLDVLRYLASEVSLNGSVNVVRELQNLAAPEAEQIVGVSMLLKSLMRYICLHLPTLLKNIEFRQTVAQYGVIGLMLFEVLEETMVASKGDE